MVWAVPLSTTELIPRSLTPQLNRAVFGVWLGLEANPLAHPVLYPCTAILEAIPKYISGRTSYHQVWLAFHSYPQVIRELCNVHRFGPPVGINPPSPCPWVDHLASGLSGATKRPIRTRFRYGFGTSIP